METARIVDPFPAKENSSKSTMATSTNPSNQQLRFDPKFSHLPAPSDDRLDSGLDSYRSIESCPSGAGMEQFEDAFQKMQLSSTSESEEVTQTVQKSDVKQDRLLLTEDAFDQDQEGDTPLHMAIIHENEAAFQFIKYAPSVLHLNITNNLAQTPLHLAVHTRQHKVCRALVIAGASLDIVDRHGNTALHIACINGNTECAKALTTKVTKQEIEQQQRLHKMVHVNQTQNLELRNFDGLTCMHLAAASQNFHLVCYLRSIGAQVDATDGKSGRTALHYAVESNNFNLVQYLITLGANVNAFTFDFCTPLHLAIGRGLQRIVLLLLENGADVNVSNLEDLRPADLAANQNQLRFLQQQPEYNDFQIQGM